MTTKDARHNTAYSKKQYRASWDSHVRQLVTLALAADVPLEEYDSIKATLERWVDDATARQNLED